MALIKKLNDLTPKFGKHCYFSEGAAIIGDVTMGDDCTVSPGFTFGVPARHSTERTTPSCAATYISSKSATA